MLSLWSTTLSLCPACCGVSSLLSLMSITEMLLGIYQRARIHTLTSTERGIIFSFAGTQPETNSLFRSTIDFRWSRVRIHFVCAKFSFKFCGIYWLIWLLSHINVLTLQDQGYVCMICHTVDDLSCVISSKICVIANLPRSWSISAIRWSHKVWFTDQRCSSWQAANFLPPPGIKGNCSTKWPPTETWVQKGQTLKNTLTFTRFEFWKNLYIFLVRVPYFITVSNMKRIR